MVWTSLTLVVVNIQAVSYLIHWLRGGGADVTECLINDDHACVGWGGGEVWVRPFEVLAYASSERR
jgi:hypothetical protein